MKKTNKYYNILLLKYFLIIFLGIYSSFSYAGEVKNLCAKEGVVVVYFNGVFSTTSDASAAKEELKRIHGSRLPNGEYISYKFLYNYSDGFEDLVETFEQRLIEEGELFEGHLELFFEIVQGGGSWWTRITNVISHSGELFLDLINIVQAASIHLLALPNSLLFDPMTEDNYAEHRMYIDRWIAEGHKLLFVAHSQGNLFANQSYDYAIEQISEDYLKVIHVAPASPIVKGVHILADLDLVINGVIRLVGSVPGATHSIPSYSDRPGGIDHQTDLLGHNFLAIYANQYLDIAHALNHAIDQALESLLTRSYNPIGGFFTVTLQDEQPELSGLLIFKPNGQHFYAPEYEDTAFYYAPCNSGVLDVGHYKIYMSNYGTTYRTVNVQLSSVNHGVMATTEVPLRPISNRLPAFILFDVFVTKNDVGGYNVIVDKEYFEQSL